MSEAIALLRDVISAVRITSPTSYSWLGRPSFRVPSQQARMLPSEVARAHLRFALTDQLYHDFYAPGRIAPVDPSRTVDLHSRNASAVKTPLEEAAPAGVVRHVGWTVDAICRDTVIVANSGLRVWARRSHTATDDGELAPGRHASLLISARSTTMSPGFIVVSGRDGWGGTGSGATIRLYWNLRHQAAARFLRLLPPELDRAGIAFLVKVLLDAASYELRRDTAVLYLAAVDFTRAGSVIGALVDRLGTDLRPAVPAFTKELAPGVGVAECPEGLVSFGQARCRSLADSLIADHRTQPGASANARLAAVVAHLAASGVRLDAPHLDPGSTADYTLPVLTRVRRRRTFRAGPSMVAPASVVACIARRLCDGAVWYRGLCNWVGPVRSDPGLVPAFGALGPDVYDGTSGIALFLAEAAVVLDDETMMRTAVGAARQATSMIGADGRDRTSIGVYRGSTGVALAAARVGVLAGCGKLLDEAGNLVAEDDERADRPDTTDLLAGHAGRIVGLLALARMLGDADLVRSASRSGEVLLDSAVRTARGGWYWPSPSVPRGAGLTGFAHGAAGIAHAFVELNAATGDNGYRHAARQAFAYENRWFSPTERNWLDLRCGRSRRSGAPKVFRCQWCHGAPGIAASRIRAHEVLGDADLLTDARAGLRPRCAPCARPRRRVPTTTLCVTGPLARPTSCFWEGRRRTNLRGRFSKWPSLQPRRHRCMRVGGARGRAVTRPTGRFRACFSAWPVSGTSTCGSFDRRACRGCSCQVCPYPGDRGSGRRPP